MQVCATEARDSYKPEIVLEWQSDTADDMSRNIDALATLVRQFAAAHPGQ